MLKWLKFSNRKQYVYLNGESWIQIACGVPHGSVLGPLITIRLISLHSKILDLFADDKL